MDEQHQEQRPRRRHHSCHRRDDQHTPAQGQQGQRQAQAPEAQHDNAASQATGLHIADNALCPVHPGARHTWGECRENACNCANNNNN